MTSTANAKPHRLHKLVAAAPLALLFPCHFHAVSAAYQYLPSPSLFYTISSKNTVCIFVLGS